jgi:chitin synthase
MYIIGIDIFFFRIWGIWANGIYDLTDYVWTLGINANSPTTAQFLDTNLSDVFKQQTGQDITQQIDSVLAAMDPQTRNQNVNCLKNVFYIGELDFRKTARCQVQNILLIIFSAILMASMGLKCMFSSLSPPSFCLMAFCSLGCFAAWA